MDAHRKIDAVDPFFFGRENRRLFGCCHSPPSGTAGKGVVVLCQTIGQEYIHSHRAFFQLANRLAERGYTTMRFDYYGCGDSEGDFGEGSLATWVEDVGAAIEEIQLRTGLQEVGLVGFRVGAALALKSALASKAVKSLVMWEIVSNGARYLADVARMQENLNKFLKRKTAPSEIDPSIPAEFLGFPMSPHLVGEFASLVLTESDIPPGVKSLIVYNQDPAPSGFAAGAAAAGEADVTAVRFIEDHKLWENELYRRLIPWKTIDAIAAWIESVTW